MPKSRASFFKRQREVSKKQKREEKLQRKLDRKTAAAHGEPAQQPGTESEDESRRSL
ncbi:MAG TPA: hypothetical protein VGX68_26000 [Thermoanaerobaculia bacterium]|jgi:hypothetical protein|nr:hypothetical protein [Thermoanaerobaculia bacterium]